MGIAALSPFEPLLEALRYLWEAL